MEEIYLWNSEKGRHFLFILRVLRGSNKKTVCFLALKVRLAKVGVRWPVNIFIIVTLLPKGGNSNLFILVRKFAGLYD
jgi:hypothetical protein